MHVSIGSLVFFGFVLYCLLDAALTDPREIRNLPKVAWVFVIVLLPLIGGIAWFIAGRPARAGAVPGSNGSGGSAGQAARYGHPVRRPFPAPPSGPRARPPVPPPVRGPDDDEAFLRGIDERLRRSKEQGPDPS